MSLQSFIRNTQLLIQQGLYESRKAFHSGHDRALQLARLEERVLFSASAVSPVLAHVAQVGGQLLVDSAPLNDVTAFHVPDQMMLDLVADFVLPVSESTVLETGSQQTFELVFLDSSVNSPEEVISSLRDASANDASRTLEYVVLDSTKDGIAQITSALLQYHDVDGLHIVSHGNGEQVQLGSTTLSLDNLDRYRTAISGWQYSMSDKADIMFYGSNLAATEDGKLLLNEFRQLAQTDVAASDTPLVSKNSAIGENSISVRHEIVILDPGVQNSAELRELLLAQQEDGRELEFFVLDADRDGVEQIDEILARYHNLDAIHVLSHGTAQGLQLGSTWLDAESINNYADTIRGWQGAFSDNADLLLYGCDLAASDAGQSLVNTLSQWSDTDVAASTDLTGYSLFGGDWDLEYRTGNIETAVVAGMDVQRDWYGLMAISVDATSTGTTVNSNVTISHTTSGTNRVMLVAVSIGRPVSTTVSSITYNGTALTLVGVEENAAIARVEIWRLIAPDIVTANVVITLSNSSHTGVTAGVMTFTGVNQATPLGTFASAQGNNTSSGSATIVSAVGELVFGAVIYDNAVDEDLNPGAGQTERWDLFAGTSANGGGSTAAGAATVDMSWSWGGTTEWSIGGVSIKPVSNLAPIITLPGAALNYTENDPATIIDSGATASDVDSADFNNGALTVDFSANGTMQDRLAIFHQGTGAGQIGVSGPDVTYGGVIIGAFTGGMDGSTPLVITFNASSTPASAQALMRNITYENVSDAPSTLDRTVRFVLTDGDGETSNTATKTIGVTAVNDAPTITNSGDARAYPIGSPATAIDTSLTVSDPDSGTLTGGTVTISSGYASGQDVLAFTNQSGINGSWSSGTGVLTLSGTATIAQYQTALRSITFQTSAGSSGLRLIAFQISDGTASSLATISTVSVGSEVASLWISSTNNATTSIGNGGLSYNDGQAVRFANPNLALGSGTSNGTFSNVFNIDTFTGDGNSDLKGLHYVNSVVTIGTTNAVTVQKGDVLLSVSSNETLGGVSVTNRDIVLFRPTIVGNYSSGTFSVLLREPGNTGGNVRDFALVETAMTVGGTPLQSGDFLMVFSGGSYDKDVSLFRPTTMSTNPTGGTLSVLVDGDGSSGIGFGARILGLELVQQNTTLGGVSLTQGQLLISLDSSDVVGIDNLSVTKFDVFTMSITATGNTTSAGTANMLLRGADVGLSAGGEEYDALALVAVYNTAPMATNLSAAEIYTEDTDLNLTDIVVSDVDSTSVTVTLTLSNIAAGSLNTGISGAVTSTYIAGTGVWTASGAIADVNILLADLTFTPTLNYNGNFTIATSVSDGVAGPITGNKAMTGIAVNDAPVHTVPAALITDTNTPLVLTGASAFWITDVDAGMGDLEVTLAAINGTLTLNGSTNLSFTTGDGVSDTSMVFRGKLSDINTALDGLTFDPTPGFNGSASISLKTDDLGNTGSGGNLSAMNVVSLIVGNATMTFREGVNGYTGTEDTELQNDNPSTSFGNATSISVDLQNGSLESQGLIQFGNLFGNAPGQIPIGSVINTASLTLNVFDTANSATTISLHRMLTTWNESSTWNSVTNGIQRNNIEAAAAVDSTMTLAQYTGPQTFYGLKSTVQSWADGGSNHGWVIVTNSTDGWDFYSSEHSTVSRRPVLTINYTAPAPAQLDLDGNNSSGAMGSGFSTTYTEDGPAVLIADSDATLTDADDTHLQSMTITLTNTLDGAAESLSANTTGTSIVASYNSGTGVLTLTNADTLANYLQVLKSVTYQNSSNTPNTTTRIITVVGHDGFADSNTATASIAIVASNDAPVGVPTISGTATEDQVLTANTSGISDPDGLGAFSYQWYRNGIALVGETRATLTLGDTDVGTIITVEVTYTDGWGTSEGPIASDSTVPVAGVNDAPMNTVPGTQTIAEDTQTAITGISISDIDANGGIVTTRLQVTNGVLNVTLAGSATISLGSNNSVDLTISGTVTDINNTLTSVRYIPNLNVAGQAVDTLTVTTNDGGHTGSGGALQDVDTIQIDVTNVNNEEVLSINTGLTVNEGDPGTVVSRSMLETTDVDNSAAEIIYTLTAVPTNGSLRLSGGALANGQTFTQSDINANLLTYAHNDTEVFTDSFAFNVNDGSGTSTAGNFAITITPVNDNAPVITVGQQFSVSELAAVGTVVGDAVATDVDTVGTLQNWTILSGNTDGIFAIDSNTGRITVIDVTRLNFEATPVYTLTLSVSDGVTTSATQTLRINVLDQNETPTFAAAPTLTVNENSANGTIVGSVAASDPDSGDVLTYAILASSPNSPFAINATTGQIRIINSSLLDFEAVTSVTLQIRVSDAAGLTDFQTVTIQITDVNEAPTDITLIGTSVNENSIGGTVVGTLFGIDPDAGDSLTFAMINSAGGRFSVDATTGILRVASGAVLNYEVAASQWITVRTTDSVGHVYEKSFTITINDINDAPVAIADHYTTPQLTTLNVTAANGLLANDRDQDGNGLTVILVTGPSHGTLTLAAGGSLRYTPQGIFTGTDTFSYQVTDGYLNSAVISVTVDVFRTISTSAGAGSTGSGFSGTGTSGSAGTLSSGPNNSSGSSAGGDSNTTVITNAVPADIGSLHRNSADRQLLFANSSGFGTDSNASVDSLADSQLTGMASIMFLVQGGENLTSATSGHRSVGNYQNLTRFVTDLFGGTVLAAPVDAIVSSAFFTFDWSPQTSHQAEGISAQITSEKVVVGSTAVVTTSLSVGYVIWILRGGSLLTAFASALPAWSSFDPLPVLNSFEKQNKEEDETFLSMVSRKAVNVVNHVVK